MQQYPSGERCDGPHENGGRPVFLDVENLPDKGDSRADGDGSDRMQRRRKRLELLARDCAAEVKDDDHGHHQQVAHAGAELIPVRGDEEGYATGEEDAAEDECDTALPGNANRRVAFSLLFLLKIWSIRAGRFESADAGGGLRVQSTGRLPAI